MTESDATSNPQPSPPLSTHTGQFPAVPASAPPGFVPPAPPVGRRRGGRVVVAGVAVVVALAVAAVASIIGINAVGGERGAWRGSIAYPSGSDDAAYHSVTFAEDTIYFSSSTEDGETWITAADKKTGAKKWSTHEPLELDISYGLNPVEPGEDAILVNSDSTGTGEAEYLIESKTGKVHELPVDDNEYYRMVAGVPVRTTMDGEIEILDATGKTRWSAESEGLSLRNMVAVATTDALDSRPLPGNPITAKQLLMVTYDGTVKVFDKDSGDVVQEESDVIGPGSSASLVFDNILYTISRESDKDVITAYDMKDDFAELDSWESDEDQSFSQLTPCTAKRVCVSGYWDDDSQRSGDMVIDLDEGVVWEAPEDSPSPFAHLSFAGDTLAVAYYDLSGQSDGEETQLYDADMEEKGEPVKGWYTAVDDRTFAAVTPSESTATAQELGDVEVSILDSKDSGVAILGSYPAYNGCAIDGADLACPVKNGYRVWRYRQ